MSIEIVPRPANQKFIDYYRRSLNMLGSEVVDSEMNVLGVFDRNGVWVFRANGMAAYIKHASGRISTFGTEPWCDFRISCAAINPFFKFHAPPSMEFTPSDGIIPFEVALFDKDYSCMSSVETGK